MRHLNLNIGRQKHTNIIYGNKLDTMTIRIGNIDNHNNTKSAIVTQTR